MCLGSKPSSSCVRIPVESISRMLHPIFDSGGRSIRIWTSSAVKDSFLFGGTLAHLLCKSNRILQYQVIYFCLIENLELHPSALNQTGIRTTVSLESLQKLLNIVCLDILNLTSGKTIFEDTQGVLVVFLGSWLDVILMVFIPHISPWGPSKPQETARLSCRIFQCFLVYFVKALSVLSCL